MANLPEEIRAAVTTALHHALEEGGVFDVYEAAIKIGEAFPDARIRIDDLVDYMISNIRGVQAVEIAPPSLLIEIVLPAGDETTDENLAAPCDDPDRVMIGPQYRAQIRSAHICIEESHLIMKVSAPMLQLHRPSPLTVLSAPYDRSVEETNGHKSTKR